MTDADGAMVFDAERVPAARPEWFEPDWWQRHGSIQRLGGGRGGVHRVDTPSGPAVLRHYHRGGMMSMLLGDRYRWRGENRTRSFREFRLLARLGRMGLPVPEVFAARYRRRRGHYTADILTRCIADAGTLAEAIRANALDEALAAAVGAMVARFHRAGVFHADLNAHNILMNGDGLHLIDFDRGSLRRPALAWQRSNLRRLRRSFLKLGACGSDPATLDATVWAALIRAWRETLHA